MISKIIVQTNATREEAQAEQKRFDVIQKHNEHHSNLVTFVFAGLALVWIGFAATQFSTTIIPTFIEPYITAVVLGIAGMVCFLAQAVDISPANSVTHEYYTALDKGNIIKVEAWKISEKDNLVDMRLVQENEDKEVFYTSISDFPVIFRTDISTPIFDLDKRAFFVPFSEREMFINAH